MPTKVTEKVIGRIFRGCLQEYGISKYQGGEPNLVILNTKNHPSNGEYIHSDNDIYIYPKSEGMDIQRTIFVMIHEFKHYHQSPTGLTRYINMHDNKPNCPYEIEANDLAERDWMKCYRELFIEKEPQFTPFENPEVNHYPWLDKDEVAKIIENKRK